MKRKLGWAAVIVLAVGTAALPLALVGSDQPPPPPMGIVLGGNVRDHSVVRDQPLPPELPGPAAPVADGFALEGPPREGSDVTGIGRRQPVDAGQPRKVLGDVDRGNLTYLGYDEDDPQDEAHEYREENCAPGRAGPEWPEDIGLTDIFGPDEIGRPPAGSGLFYDEPCEEPIEDEI